MMTPAEAAARGFAGPVVHMLFASIWGFTIGCAHLRGTSLTVGIVRGFVIAAALHGHYDFIVLQNSMFALPIAAVLIVVIWLWRLRLLQVLHENALRDTAIDRRRD